MNETWPEIKKRKLKERRGETFDWIQSLVVALFACVLIFTFLVRVVGVVGTSMLNTLHPGDRILVSNLFYTPKRGDIIVLRKESFNSEPIVKRVIATEGETVTIDFEGGIVYVDGVALDEPYTLEPTHRRIDFGDSVTVPEGCLFVMATTATALPTAVTTASAVWMSALSSDGRFSCSFRAAIPSTERAVTGAA